ncbi:hypothetical protein TYRP_009369 [Tyrophagus putrescentiae]|nr:hypothetical protein TYRP_009369 [Tyrophagus putrescentiae]
MPLKQLGSSRIVFKSKGAESSDLREQFQRCAKGIDGSSNSSRSLLMRISGIRGTGACAAAEV